MDRKNKAVKAVNTALGLIVLVMVLLCSPLFGYARGFASKEQRESAAAPVSAPRYEKLAPVSATPRPTPPPTPTPVVLPTAPPAPPPTPVPQYVPRTTPQPAAAQQPVYNANTWQQDEYYEPEPDYEPEIVEEVQEPDLSEAQQPSDVGGQITDTGNGGVIQGDEADLVIDLPGGMSGGQSEAISVTMPEAADYGGGDIGGGDAGGGDVGGGDYGGADVAQPGQDVNEADYLA